MLIYYLKWKKNKWKFVLLFVGSMALFVWINSCVCVCVRRFSNAHFKPGKHVFLQCIDKYCIVAYYYSIYIFTEFIFISIFFSFLLFGFCLLFFIWTKKRSVSVKWLTGKSIHKTLSDLISSISIVIVNWWLCAKFFAFILFFFQ